MHLMAAMRENNIQFRAADQSVRIEGEIGSRVLDSISLMGRKSEVSGDAGTDSAAGQNRAAPHWQGYAKPNTA